MKLYSLRALMLGSTALCGLMIAVPVCEAATLPQGGRVVVGAGTISQSGATLTVDQSGNRAIVHWDSFSIGPGGTVQFNNGSGATLNRVTGGELSSILGTLKASGTLYLINPNGIVVGASGQVVTGGSFIASTHDILNDAFLNGQPLLFKGDSTAKVENLGSISSTGGNVFLIARDVLNKGTISAPQGTVGLAGGHEVLLTESTGRDSERVLVRVGPGSVDNQGTIEATQAELKAAGGNIYALAGNNGGVIRATGSVTRDGRVWLVADGGHVQNTGTVSARNADGSGGTVTVSAPGRMVMNTGTLAADGTRGGAVRVSADRVANQGRISADGSDGDGGAVTVAYGKTYIDTTASTLSARGRAKGGSVSVSSTAPNSTLFASGQHIADGTGGGSSGGSIDLFGGTISLVDAVLDASGGASGGSIRIGGDYQGSGAMLKAATTLLSPTTTVRADAR
ncbi:MAG: filamentous hemagglutinin N-terminal domain-containing protein, partial [Rhodospirillaceae bacterium]